MREGETEREAAQVKAMKIENEFESAVCENLKLKGLGFDIEYKSNYYKLLIQQGQKKLKATADK